MKENQDPNSIQELPRVDLREEAFRRYEPYMFRSCHAMSITVDPWDFPTSLTKPMRKASSFICRFNDAKTGYKRYNYKSVLPPLFDVDNLRPVELTNKSVLIKNLMFTGKGSPILSADHVGLQLLADKIKSGELAQSARIPIRMVESSMAADIAFIESLQTEDSPYYGFFATTPSVSNGFLWILMDE